MLLGVDSGAPGAVAQRARSEQRGKFAKAGSTAPNIPHGLSIGPCGSLSFQVGVPVWPSPPQKSTFSQRLLVDCYVIAPCTSLLLVTIGRGGHNVTGKGRHFD